MSEIAVAANSLPACLFILGPPPNGKWLIPVPEKGRSIVQGRAVRRSVAGRPFRSHLDPLEGSDMKKILGLVLVVAAGFGAYRYVLNVPEASAEESALAGLERQFDAATQQMMRASRSTGATGLDGTSEAEAARAAVRRVESELQRLQERLEPGPARQRADRLEEKIRAFRQATD
jgi:hypothetical protein